MGGGGGGGGGGGCCKEGPNFCKSISSILGAFEMPKCSCAIYLFLVTSVVRLKWDKFSRENFGLEKAFPAFWAYSKYILSASGY